MIVIVLRDILLLKKEVALLVKFYLKIMVITFVFMFALIYIFGAMGVSLKYLIVFYFILLAFLIIANIVIFINRKNRKQEDE